MHKFLSIVLVCAPFAIPLSASAVPITFDFENTPATAFDDAFPGDTNKLVLEQDGLTIEITRLGNAPFDVVSNTGPQVKPGIFGERSLAPFAHTSDRPFLVNFSRPVAGVSVDMGDYGADTPDVLSLRAFALLDGGGTLVNADSTDLPTIPPNSFEFNFETLSVKATPNAPIRSLLMNGGTTNFPTSVFFDNLQIEAPRLRVSTAAPTAGSATVAGNPTGDNWIVITHGWEPFGGPDWMFEMASTIAQRFPDAKVIVWAWDDAFGPLNLPTATAQAAMQGEALAKYLIDIGAENVHFVGHSLGTHVNAFAAQDLIIHGISVEQVTILDRPFGTVPITSGVEQVLYGETMRGVKWVDNYYGRGLACPPLTGCEPVSITGTGAPLIGAYNQLLPDENHSGVHDWYESTIARQEPGFYWSIVGGGAADRPDPQIWTPPDPQRVSFLIATADLSSSIWNAIRAQTSGTSAALIEGSPAYLWADITIPEEAPFLSFEFSWINPGDGDYLTLHFGDNLLFSFLGSILDDSEFLSSGPIDISAFRGLTNQLLFTLNSVGEANAELSIKNLSFFGISPLLTQVPEPSSALLLVSGLIGLAAIARMSGRGQIDQHTLLKGSC